VRHGQLAQGPREASAAKVAKWAGARAMHYKADLIVLDEPTAALGVAEVRKVLDFVRMIWPRVRLH
jgi:ABC-type sugar transport system ATPase subunit